MSRPSPDRPFSDRPILAPLAPLALVIAALAFTMALTPERELDLLPDWYFTQLRGLTLSDADRAMLAKTFALIKAEVLAQPVAFVHRDYHSRNLMASPLDAQARPGVIDFQDAVWGPITYDLVSLLRDAYVSWNEERQIDLAIRYWEKARRAGLPVNTDVDSFYRDFEAARGFACHAVGKKRTVSIQAELPDHELCCAPINSPTQSAFAYCAQC